MTIHKSKGLEFPVVFVSGLGRKMNQMDASDRLVVHPDLGLGICEISGQPRVKKNSVFRSEIATGSAGKILERNCAYCMWH